MALSKTYNPADVEEKWYSYWMENGLFKSTPDDREAYTVVIPPPNVTGVLHMGHMLNNTIQDVLVRRARMQGKNACWVPGTDHASIATEAKVVALLKEKGIDKKDISREEFLKYAWEWKEKYGGIILNQLQKLGCSCDWDRERFTMEESLSEAVIKVFVDLHKKGLIYRGVRMINWDPAGGTALSDEEVIHKEVNSKLYYVKYKVEGEDNYITIATTRPETILGDTAVCVNPNDDRYKALVGKKVIVPMVNRAVPVIADEYVDMEFGTGCLKITPAHDINDYNIGMKHKLEVIDVIADNGTISEAGQLYIGEDRFVVRKKIAKDIEELGQLVKVEELTNKVGYSERTGAVIEPKLSAQWFVDMKKFVDKNPEVLDSVMNDEIRFHPAKFKNTYRHWIENIKDWCISRQLWWGQRIPAFYLPNGDIVVGETPELALLEAKKIDSNLTAADLRQDEDVLDTWFSSWLWPISVFDGFKEEGKEELDYYYPTSDLVTGHDIMFFWVARMIMAGYEYEDKKPFDNVYFTGMVRDKQRRKMSKSLGNSPDALGLIEKFGADGVRMGMLLASPAGNDILYDDALVEQGRNFCNKIWNAYRLIEGWEVVADHTISEEIINANNIAAEWMQGRINGVLGEIDDKFKDYRLSEALMSIYKLIWDDYCAWYLEMVKPEYGKPINESTLAKTKAIFEDLLKVLHPFMPFITEELYQELNGGKAEAALMVQLMPKVKPSSIADADNVLKLISEVRNIRNAKGISPKEALDISIKPYNGDAKAQYEQFRYLITKLANTSNLVITDGGVEDAMQVMVDKDELYVHINELVDMDAEKQKMEEEVKYLKGFLIGVDKKLSNERFVANANPEVVDKERQKKADAEAKIKLLEEALSKLN